MIQFICFQRLIAVMAGIAAIVKAGNLEERQNPGFITTLPTLATNSIVIITTTATATSAPSELSTTSGPLTQATPAPSSTSLASPTPATAVSALQGPFFGGVPENNVDIPLTSAFLILFLVGAIINAIFYRSKSRLTSSRSKRTSKDVVSGLAVLFCLARVLSCVLRNVWAVASTSTGAIFLALVSENAGTAFLFFLNFYLAKRMIGFFNMRMSLWAKTIIDSSSKISVIGSLAVIVLLNTVGVALFEFQSADDNHASTAINLVQISEGLLLILGLTLLGTVLLIRISAENPQIPRLTTRTVVFFTGAGMFTMTSQLVRMASSFGIWTADNTRSTAILSKPTYYITGMGFEIMTIVLYTSTRIDLLFSSVPSLGPFRMPRPTTAASSRSLSDTPLRMNPILTKSSRSGSLPLTDYSFTDIVSTPMDSDRPGSGREQRIETTVTNGIDDAKGQNGLFISIHRTFSISSQRMSTITPHSSRG